MEKLRKWVEETERHQEAVDRLHGLGFNEDRRKKIEHHMENNRIRTRMERLMRQEIRYLWTIVDPPVGAVSEEE